MAVNAVSLAIKEDTESGRGTIPSTGHNTAEEISISITGGHCLTLPVFNWTAKEKYIELGQFETEMTNIFLTKHCDISDAERVPIVKHLTGEREAPQLICTLDKIRARNMLSNTRALQNITQ